MRFLLDTHSLIWALSEPEKLSTKIATLLADSSNLSFVSVASLWELQIKRSIGKIRLPSNFTLLIADYGYELLSITPEHVAELEGLPLLHRDPFDRIIVAQSLYENLPIVTKDSEIIKYKINVIEF